MCIMPAKNYCRKRCYKKTTKLEKQPSLELQLSSDCCLAYCVESYSKFEIFILVLQLPRASKQGRNKSKWSFFIIGCYNNHSFKEALTLWNLLFLMIIYGRNPSSFLELYSLGCSCFSLYSVTIPQTFLLWLVWLCYSLQIYKHIWNCLNWNSVSHHLYCSDSVHYFQFFCIFNEFKMLGICSYS